MVRLVIVNANANANANARNIVRVRREQLKHYRIEMHFTNPFQMDKKISNDGASENVDWFKFKFPSTSNRKAPFIKFNIKKALYNKFNASINNIEYTANTFKCDISIPRSIDFACYIIYNHFKQEVKNMDVLNRDTEYNILPIQNILYSQRDLRENMCNFKVYKLLEPGIIPPLVNGITTYSHYMYIEKKNVMLYLERPGIVRQNSCETFTIEAIQPLMGFNNYVSTDDIIDISAITDPNTDVYVMQRIQTQKIPNHILDKERWEKMYKILQKHSYADKDNNKENICTICIEEQTEEDVFYSHPVCNHSFHLNCLKEWACQGRSKILCPNCRAEFKG